MPCPRKTERLIPTWSGSWKRMGAKTIEIEASHLALISHPDAITNLILEALAV